MTKLESGAVVPNTALHDLGEIVGTALQPRRQDPRAAPRRGRSRRRPADAASSTRCCSSRCCSTCWTMPPNTRRRRRPSASAAGSDGRSVCLQVLDEGDGIPPGDLERIFDKFYRVQKGDQVRAGTGLGLAISRGFVEAMHGTITAANRTDRSGAVFTIRLPVPAATREAGHRRMSAAPLKVLVVDDEPPIRKLLRMGLAHPGLRDPRCAERQGGARAARAEARPRHPRPRPARHPGPRPAAADPRRRNEGVPIVVLSSRGDEAGKVQALDLGADDYVTKPFGMDELLARMRAALRHQLQVHGERPVFRVGDLSVDLVRRIVKARRQGGEAVAQGIRPPAPPGAARRQGADPQVPARGAVGRSHRRAVSAGLRPPAAAEDRSRTRSGRTTS